MSRLLSAGATDVWFLRVDEHRDLIPDAQLAWLTPEEIDRATRFRFARDRRLYLASHVLLRGLLSQYAGLPPSAWRFRTDELGKPRVENAAIDVPAFSLAHTRGLACCAISCSPAVGVDAEALDRLIDAREIWSECCSPSELRDLERLEGSDRQARFLSYWTLKESLSKAVGCGLTGDVTRLSFEIDDEPIRVLVSPPWDVAASWQFGLFQVPGYTVGVSVNAGERQIRLYDASLKRLQ